MASIEFSFGAETGQERASGYDKGLKRLVDVCFASRLFAKDASLWGDDAQQEASMRLGWTDFGETAARLIPEIEALRAELFAEGIDRFVLCGMGGSSLAPAVIAKWAGVPLTILDSTHPATVLRALGGSEQLARTGVIVSSKSGSTIETLSHLAAFESAFAQLGIAPASRIIVVTDPGSPFEIESRAAGRRVFVADPAVGGRFSALTAFGLVPAGLVGADLLRLVSDAEAVLPLLARDDAKNPALRLAAAVAAGLPERYLLATRSLPGADWGLADWIEQLVAESTGKKGVGVLPISLDTDAVEFRRPSGSIRTLTVTDASKIILSDRGNELEEHGLLVAAELGAQFLFWEVATAALGALMGIDPFDQPDVESAKQAARVALRNAPDHAQTPAGSAPSNENGRPKTPAHSPASVKAWLHDSVPEGGYLVLQAFLDPGAGYGTAMHELREKLAESIGLPVALSWGPRYLHSTGQLHKGGPALGAFLQFVEESMTSLEIPGSGYDFDTLLIAQAQGDREVLLRLGRPVLTVKTSDPAETAGSLIRAL